jgi:hypothetical protein
LKKIAFYSLLITSFLLFGFNAVISNESTPTGTTLFKIETSKDNNQLFYDANINSNGDLDTLNPINIYWKKNTESGIIKPLTWIQKKYAYGLTYYKITNEYATFRFVSYKKLFFTLKKTKNNQFEVYTKLKDKILKIDRLFIQIDGGSFLFPNITIVKIYAKDIRTGKNLVEVVTP